VDMLFEVSLDKEQYLKYVLYLVGKAQEEIE
jgi:hypothetical protein